MKRFVCLLLLTFFLTACSLFPSSVHELSVTIPAQSDKMPVFVEEILTPTRDTLRLWTVSSPYETVAVLIPLYADDGEALPSVYLTGLATKVKVEAGTAYRLGILVTNPADEAVSVVIGVGNAELSIACE